MAFTFGKIKDSFFTFYKNYEKQKETLSEDVRSLFESKFQELSFALKEKRRKEARSALKELSLLSRKYCKKHPLLSFFEFPFSLVCALVFAIFIRQTWFELYEIPTGSMRPTLMEGDRLVVSKNQFGFNFPLTPGHFYLNEDQIDRMKIVTFTGEGMDLRDVKTRYFYIFPGYKQYVKRLIGKPGDTLYFYGGKIYGIDKNGADISPLLQPQELLNIEHIPFLHPERLLNNLEKPHSSYTFHQSKVPLAKIDIMPTGVMQKKLLGGLDSSDDFYSFWGMENFAVVRIINPDQLPYSAYIPSSSERPLCYLEIVHHPSLWNAKLQQDNVYGHKRAILGHETSYLPLDENDLQTLFSNLYTSRFVIENGYARREGALFSGKQASYHLPQFPKIPDGRYEFYDGKLYQIGFQTLRKELKKDHPLYQFDTERVKNLFNLGMEFDKRILPRSPFNLSSFYPSRYLYFRDNNLYVMGKLFLEKNSPKLKAFITTEEQKAKLLTSYKPFIDQKAPLLEDGSLDLAKIERYGLKVPLDHYFVLGDNHANSADSREFGFVPKENIRGVPSVIFWTPGIRSPVQPPYPLFTLTKSITWAVALIVWILWMIYKQKRVAPIIAHFTKEQTARAFV